jgi:hypothetical protein
MSFAERIIARVTRREPDFIIGGKDDPYVRRWWVIPRNRLFNVYLHQFVRSDDDRALHDHPWVNCSILLRGCYEEHLPGDGVRFRKAGDVVFRRSGRMAHRVMLLQMGGGEIPCWTLFITGPRYREWGFHCPRGWVHWKLFTAPDDTGTIGKGCDQ